MITLAKFGPAYGLPDPSPFVLKTEILLKMAGLDYVGDDSPGAFRRAPKGKIPYLVDGGAAIPDSTFIRLHLEKTYGIDFDKGLTPVQRAQGWAFEKMAEDHLYWAITYSRWMERANFDVLKANMRTKLPPVVGPAIITIAQRKVKSYLRGQGFGRHTRGEIYELGRRDLAAIATALADKPYLFGPEPKAADAALGGFMMAVLCEPFDGPLEAAARANAALVAYAERIGTRFFDSRPHASAA